MLPDELLDDLLFDARVQHVGHQTGISQDVTGTAWPLWDNRLWFRTGEIYHFPLDSTPEDRLKGEKTVSICIRGQLLWTYSLLIQKLACL